MQVLDGVLDQRVVVDRNHVGEPGVHEPDQPLQPPVRLPSEHIELTLLNDRVDTVGDLQEQPVIGVILMVKQVGLRLDKTRQPRLKVTAFEAARRSVCRRRNAAAHFVA